MMRNESSPYLVHPRTYRSCAATAASLLLALGLGGCPFVPTDGGTDVTGNDTFETATVIALGSNDEADFTARIDDTKDADIFDLGVLSPGDRLYIDVQTTDGDLDPLAAVFDEREYLLAFSDDRVPDASNLNPLIDVIVHGPAGHYFLGVAPFRGSGSTGKYRVIVRVTRNVGILTPEPQIVFLDWEGGRNIRIENVGVYNVDPFDAGDVGPYSGRTEELKDAVQDVIEDRYDGYNLVVLNSDDHAVPTNPHSTVYFGGSNSSAFAIAEKLDSFNADQTDNAIVFTEGFQSAFSVIPSFAQMATALGNTAAHEIGHLLGLVHTKDCTSLMDTSCSNDALLREQIFKLAPLDGSVFPIGLQNAVELVEWVLGLVEGS